MSSFRVGTLIDYKYSYSVGDARSLASIIQKIRDENDDDFLEENYPGFRESSSALIKSYNELSRASEHLNSIAVMLESVNTNTLVMSIEKFRDDYISSAQKVSLEYKKFISEIKDLEFNLDIELYSSWQELEINPYDEFLELFKHSLLNKFEKDIRNSIKNRFSGSVYVGDINAVLDNPDKRQKFRLNVPDEESSLSEKELLTFNLVKEFILEFEYPPMVWQLSRLSGVSNSVLRGRLNLLVSKGWVSKGYREEKVVYLVDLNLEPKLKNIYHPHKTYEEGTFDTDDVFKSLDDIRTEQPFEKMMRDRNVRLFEEKVLSIANNPNKQETPDGDT